MLTFLAISNLAVIEKLELELHGGLTVVTGETGAGKSMLLAGLTLLLGDKLDPQMVRSGADALTVEGSWTPAAWKTDALLEILDGEPVDDEVVVRRTLSLDESRRDRLRVADRLVGRARLNAAAADLVSIASQQEYVALLKRTQHLHLLDSYGRLEALRERTAAAFERFRSLEKKLDDLTRRSEQRSERMTWLRTLVDQLGEAAIEPGEEEELLGQIDRLAHGVEITRALQGALDALYEDDQDLLGGLGQVARSLQSVQRYEPGVVGPADRIDAACAELEDVVGELRRILGHLDVDPGLLDHLQGRVAFLQKLKRRYHVESSDGLLALLEESTRELAELEEIDFSLEKLRRELADVRADFLGACAALHHARAAAAATLRTAVEQVLGELEMPRAVLTVDLVFDEESAGRLGADRVEFLFSANPGQPPRALQKVASGGELSRVLLAFKAVLADADPVPTYVFDEIDAGVGGKTALAVGRLLARLARNQQVICITHTAQLAAFANHHLVVGKEEVDGQTLSTVRALRTKAERAEELARMLSGLEESTTALRHARELLDSARQSREP